jgi:hypothetical protein
LPIDRSEYSTDIDPQAVIDHEDFTDELDQIEEEPFPSLSARTAQVKSQIEQLEDYEQDDDSIEMTALKKQLRNIGAEILVAYIDREKRFVQEHFQDKGIKIFSTSLNCYLKWQNSFRDRDPLLGIEATGILELIRFFLGLPASTNLKNWFDFVTKVLPAFQRRANRVLEKHTEDEVYASMRQDVALRIPTLKTSLEATMASQLQSTIAAPWTDCADIVKGIEDLFITNWTWLHIPHNSWAKMLRKNGIPINGVYFGENFN